MFTYVYNRPSRCSQLLLHQGKQFYIFFAMIPFYKSKFDPIAQKNILNQMYITISWIEYIIELISSISKFRDVYTLCNNLPICPFMYTHHQWYFCFLYIHTSVAFSFVKTIIQFSIFFIKNINVTQHIFENSETNIYFYKFFIIFYKSDLKYIFYKLYADLYSLV